MNRFDRRQHAIGDHSSYEVASYLSYQGEKLAERFDANSYLRLLDAMNSHDIGRKRGASRKLFNGSKVPIIGISFTRDLLYPPEKLEEFTNLINKQGKRADFYQVESKFGHDGFLVEFEKWGLHCRERAGKVR